MISRAWCRVCYWSAPRSPSRWNPLPVARSWADRTQGSISVPSRSSFLGWLENWPERNVGEDARVTQACHVVHRKLASRRCDYSKDLSFPARGYLRVDWFSFLLSLSLLSFLLFLDTHFSLSLRTIISFDSSASLNALIRINSGRFLHFLFLFERIILSSNLLSFLFLKLLRFLRLRPFEMCRCELILRDFSIFFFFFEPSSFDPPFLKSFQYSSASVWNT